MKQLAILNISSAPSVKNVAQISSHSFWLNQIILTFLHISTVVNSHIYQFKLPNICHVGFHIDFSCVCLTLELNTNRASCSLSNFVPGIMGLILQLEL